MLYSYLREKIQAEKFSRESLWIIVAVNLAGTAFGFYYYAEQLGANPFHLWPLIPDSPVATLLMAISLLLYLKNFQSGLLDALAFLANLKYGLWTVFVLLYYSEVFYAGNSLPMYLFLLFSHLAMAIQSLLILDYTELRLSSLLPGALWFGLNDILDYALGIHTRIYTPENTPAMAAAAGLTLLSIALYLLHLRDS